MAGKNTGVIAAFLVAAMLFTAAGCAQNNQPAVSPNASPSSTSATSPNVSLNITPSASPTAASPGTEAAQTSAERLDRTKMLAYTKYVAPGVDAVLAENAWQCVNRTVSFIFTAGSLVTEARIIKIERIETVSGLLQNPIELWKVEFRLKPDNLEKLQAQTNSRLNFEDGWVTEMDRSEWQPVLVVERKDRGTELLFTASTHFFEASGGTEATLKSMLRDKIALNKRICTVESGVDAEIAAIAWQRVLDGVNYIESMSNPHELSVLEAKITKLTYIKTYSGISANPVEVWKLEYRLKPDDFSHVIFADGMSSEDGWVTQKSIVGDPIIIIERAKDGAKYIGSTNTESYDSSMNETAFKILYDKVQKGKDYKRVGGTSPDPKVSAYIWDYIDTRIDMYFKPGSVYPSNTGVRFSAAAFDNLKLQQTFEGVLDAPVEIWYFTYRMLPENKNPIMFAVGGQDAVKGWFKDTPRYLIVKRTASGAEYLGVVWVMSFEGGLTYENLKRVLSDLKTAK